MAVDYATLKKGGFMRQKQKNNFSLRLRVVGGNVTAKQLAKIAEVAEEFGDGYVHLTSRQSVEIPFIKLDQIEQVKAKLAEGDVEPGVCGPRVRTITACHGQEICPSGCIDTYALAKELDDRYFARELPHKFKFGITGCQNNCLKAEENDVGIKGGIQVKWIEDKCIQCGVCPKACRTDAITLEDGKIIIDNSKCNYCGRCTKACPVDAYEEIHGYIVSFGGLFGNTINKGDDKMRRIDILIIGSGPARLSAAIYGIRGNATVLLAEKEYLGTGQIAESGQVDNYLGMVGVSGYDLGETFRQDAEKLGTEFYEGEAVSIKKQENQFFVTFDNGEQIVAKTVIYAAGAVHRHLGLEEETDWEGKGISYCAICDGAFYKDRTVVVVGGGDTALDDAKYLSDLCEKVYLVHRRDAFRGSQKTLAQLREKENVEIITNAQIAKIEGEKKYPQFF